MKSRPQIKTNNNNNNSSTPNLDNVSEFWDRLVKIRNILKKNTTELTLKGNSTKCSH